MKNISLCRKLVSVVFIISLLFSIFNIGYVLAASPKFELYGATILEKSDGVKASISDFGDNKLVTDVTFYKVDDYVSYKLTVKNNSKTKYKLVSVSDNNSSNNVTYEYEYTVDEELSPKGTVDVILKTTYKTEVEDINNRDQNQEVKITFIMEDEEGNVDSEDIIHNPKTGDKIAIYVSAMIISLMCLLLIVFRKKITRFFVLSMILIPIITFAASPSMVVLVVSSTKLHDKIVINSLINGQTISKVVSYNSTPEKPEDPEIEGYTFDNWYVNGEVYNFDEPLTEDVEIVAKFNLINYEINYDYSGGNNPGNPTSYNVETETFDLINPTKQGYTFSGWTGSNGDGLQTRVTIEKGSTGNKSYVAHFSVNQNTTYKVIHRYKKLDGTYEEEIENLSGATNTVVTPAVRSKTGFVNPETQELTILPSGNASVTYTYEREKYTLTLQDASYIESEFTTGEYEYDTKITLTAKNKEHYDFDKWSNGSTSNPLEFNITGDITIGPEYKVKQYTVSFDARGGVDVDSITKDYNQPISNLPETAKTGCLFDGWFTEAEGGTKITADTLVTGTVTYYAHWTKTMSLAEISPSSITMITHDEATITVSNVDEEYTFTSSNESVASVDANGKVTAVGKGSATITIHGTRSSVDKTVNVTVNPKMYTINFNTHGGSSVDSMDVEENTTINPLPATTYEGYLFDGWFTEETGGERLETTTPITTGRTYHAHWTKSVSLAQISPSSITLYRGQNTTITVSNVEEEYTFASSDTDKVTVDNNGLVSGVAKGSAVITIHGTRSGVDKTVNVTVNPNIYTINFNAHGGSSVGSMDVEEFTTINPLPTTTYEGHMFDGWYTEETGGERLETTIPITTGRTYHAHWTAKITEATITPSDLNIELDVYETAQITISQVPNLEEYTIESSDTGVAIVNSNGKVTAVSKGTAVITIRGTRSNEQIDITVTVNSVTVTFENDGDTYATKEAAEGGTLAGHMPSTPSKSGYNFIGWFVDGDLDDEFDENTVVNADITVVAMWADVNSVARIGNHYYLTLNLALADVPTTGEETEVIILKDFTASNRPTVVSGQRVVIDAGNHTLTCGNNNIVYNNNGIVTIKNGTYTCNTDKVATLENNYQGTMYITGGTILNTNSTTNGRAAVYNGGKLYISGDAKLSSVALDRPTVHNYNGASKLYMSDGTVEQTNANCSRGAIQNGVSSARMEITGGTVISASTNSNSGAIQNITGATVTIGTKNDNKHDKTTPVIRGTIYAVNSETGFNFYDGILEGVTNVTNVSYSDITHENGMEAVDDETVDIGGVTYKTLYYANP